MPHPHRQAKLWLLWIFPQNLLFNNWTSFYNVILDCELNKTEYHMALSVIMEPPTHRVAGIQNYNYVCASGASCIISIEFPSRCSTPDITLIQPRSSWWLQIFWTKIRARPLTTNLSIVQERSRRLPPPTPAPFFFLFFSSLVGLPSHSNVCVCNICVPVIWNMVKCRHDYKTLSAYTHKSCLIFFGRYFAKLDNFLLTKSFASSWEFL